jgi:predicted metalloprotease
VLGSTEQVWTQVFAKEGQRYTPTTLVAYTSGTRRDRSSSPGTWKRGCALPRRSATTRSRSKARA